MKQLRHRITIFFAVIVALFLCLSIGKSPIDVLNHQEYVIFRAGQDFMADFFNVQRYIAENDPYFNEINGQCEKAYLPLCYLILKPFNHFCDYANMSLQECWESPLAEASALVFLLLSLFFFFHSFILLNRNNEWKSYHLLLLVFSSVFLFSIERGNLIILTVACVNYFLAFYDSKNVWKYRFGLLCLCLAAVIKVYPVLFGIMLLKDKRYKDIAYCIAAGLILTFVPFLFFEHGLANVPQLIENVKAYTASYSNSSSVYKFGMIVLGQVLPSATLVIRIITALLSLATLVLAFFEKRRWLQAALICMVILLYPANSAFYCGLYLFPLLALFFNKQDYCGADYTIAVLLCLIMNPIQIVIYTTTITPIIANVSSIILWILLLIYSIVWKD